MRARHDTHPARVPRKALAETKWRLGGARLGRCRETTSGCRGRWRTSCRPEPPGTSPTRDPGGPSPSPLDIRRTSPRPTHSRSPACRGAPTHSAPSAPPDACDPRCCRCTMRSRRGSHSDPPSSPHARRPLQIRVAPIQVSDGFQGGVQEKVKWGLFRSVKDYSIQNIV